MRRPASSVALALVVLAALVWFVPWALRDRTAYTGTPTPPPFASITRVALKPGHELCVRSAALDPETRRAVFLTDHARGRGPALRVRAVAPGYSASARIAGGYAQGAAVVAALPDGPRRSVVGQVCARNEGAVPVVLVGSLEFRVLSRSRSYLDGRLIEPRVALALLEGSDRSIASRPGEVLEHVAAFDPWYVGKVSLALLALLVVLGVPFGVVWALRAAERG